MRRPLLALAFAAFLVGAAGVAPAAAADRPDSWLTMKTKIALLTTEGIDTSDLNVDTVEGVVTLHGKVASETARTKAQEIAGAIDGVKQVKNLLQVVPEPNREQVQTTDDKIEAGVETAFQKDHALAESDIVVASVNNGVVLLSGKSPSVELHLQAIETANHVKGVRRVATEVYIDEATGE
jgi:hyperosmotically inducible protein